MTRTVVAANYSEFILIGQRPPQLAASFVCGSGGTMSDRGPSRQITTKVNVGFRENCRRGLPLPPTVHVANDPNPDFDHWKSSSQGRRTLDDAFSEPLRGTSGCCHFICIQHWCHYSSKDCSVDSTNIAHQLSSAQSSIRLLRRRIQRDRKGVSGGVVEKISYGCTLFGH